MSMCKHWPMLLYNSTVSGNCYKVRLIAAHLGIPLELEELSVVDRSNRAEVLGDLNPARRVPTLVLDDGRPLAESNAIIWYLGDGTEYAPSDPYERAQVLQWQFFEQYQVEPSLAVVRFLIAFSGQAEKHADRIREQTANGYIALDAMERHLEGREFLVGGRYTLADISLYAYTHVAPEGGFDLDGTRRSGPGSRGSQRSRVTSRSTPERVRRFASASHRARPGRCISATPSAPRPTAPIADANGGALVLRIDDTDPERNVPGGEEAILADLEWLGIGVGGRARSGRANAPLGMPRRPRWRSTTGRSGTRTARSGSPGRRSPVRTVPRPISSRPSSTISISASPTSSGAPTTGRTRRCTADRARSRRPSCPR